MPQCHQLAVFRVPKLEPDILGFHITYQVPPVLMNITLRFENLSPVCGLAYPSTPTEPVKRDKQPHLRWTLC